jgi:cytochrome P450 family 6
MYPPLPILPRICTSNYKIPGTNITLETGMRVSLPIHALQMDAKYFPQPETFNPERFNTDLKEMQYTFMPFGEGPRQCIGE